ncbi:DNA-3-methyladenine glycosylase [bacterium]|nr:DNA-3-methyladenine glycosylase [bacterium]
MKPVGAEFFARAAPDVARDLLGAVLRVRAADGRATAGRIVEVEAYGGRDDPASHAHRGPTPRSAVMFGPPGVVYVYLIYGMHHCLNLVTGPAGEAGAVLVRAVEPLEGQALMARRRDLDAHRHRPRDLAAGPGRLCQAFGIDLAWNGLPVDDGGPDEGDGPRLGIVPAAAPPTCATGPRIGITRAADRPLRFVIPDSHCLSR